MSLTLWQPMSREIERFFSDRWQTDDVQAKAFAPKVHVEESEKHLTVQVELPGMNEKDIDVQIDKNILTISGERQSEKKEEKKGYYYSEVQFGKFERKIRLPEYVDTNSAQAEYRKGVLKLSLDKKPEASARQIEVKTSE